MSEQAPGTKVGSKQIKAMEDSGSVRAKKSGVS